MHPALVHQYLGTDLLHARRGVRMVKRRTLEVRCSFTRVLRASGLRSMSRRAAPATLAGDPTALAPNPALPMLANVRTAPAGHRRQGRPLRPTPMVMARVGEPGPSNGSAAAAAAAAAAEAVMAIAAVAVAAGAVAVAVSGGSGSGSGAGAVGGRLLLLLLAVAVHEPEHSDAFLLPLLQALLHDCGGKGNPCVAQLGRLQLLLGLLLHRGVAAHGVGLPRRGGRGARGLGATPAWATAQYAALHLGHGRTFPEVTLR
jgi:hypothetical protein